MPEPSTAPAGARPRSTAKRWFLGVAVLLGAVYVVLSIVPIHHVEHERDNTQGIVAFMRQVQEVQARHLEGQGRYLGQEAWEEWPPGPFPSADGVPWGVPTGGFWASLPVRPTQPVLFKLRLCASDDPAQAPKDVWSVPPDVPWYVLQARADLDGDGVLWLIEMTSAAAAAYVKNEGD